MGRLVIASHAHSLCALPSLKASVRMPVALVTISMSRVIYLTTMLACWPPQKYALDTTQLAVIELAVVGLLEAKRYEGYKKTGEVSFHN